MMKRKKEKLGQQAMEMDVEEAEKKELNRQGSYLRLKQKQN